MEKEECLCESTKVLIISDRLIESAKILSSYLCSEGIQVVGVVENKQQVLSTVEQQSIDYLIIVGYLKDISNYEVIDELKNRKKMFVPLHWAMLDSLILGYCQQYKIPLKFDRTLPLGEFARYLQKHREDKFSYCGDNKSNFGDSYSTDFVNLNNIGMNGDFAAVANNVNKKHRLSFINRLRGIRF